MVDAIKEYLGITLLVAAGGLLITQTMRLHTSQLEIAKLELEMSDARAQTAIAVEAASASARRTEQGLSLSSATTRKETNEAIRNLTTQRDALLRRLLNAETNRTSSTPLPQATSATSARGIAPANSGAEFLGSFGSADVEEALRADTIRLQLVACYRQYEEARKALSQ